MPNIRQAWLTATIRPWWSSTAVASGSASSSMVMPAAVCSDEKLRGPGMAHHLLLLPNVVPFPAVGAGQRLCRGSRRRAIASRMGGTTTPSRAILARTLRRVLTMPASPMAQIRYCTLSAARKSSRE